MMQINDMVRNALQSLRDSISSEVVEPQKRIAPGIWFSMNEPWKGAKATFTTGSGSLLQIRLDTPTAGAWFTLNIELGDVDFTALRYIGVAMRMRSTERTLLMRICVRSYHENDTYEDTFLPDYFLAHMDYSSQISGLWVHETDALLKPAKWRTLLIFLETSSFELVIEDMSLLIS